MEKELREEMKAQYQKAVKQKNSQIFWEFFTLVLRVLD
jgi:hypothetical protein